MKDKLYEFYSIPKPDRRYLILATPRSGSSTLNRALTVISGVPNLSPQESPFDEGKFLKDLDDLPGRGVGTKIDPWGHSVEFIDKIVGLYDRVVVLIRENIIEHSESMLRAGFYQYDGRYSQTEEIEKELQKKLYKPSSLYHSIERTHCALKFASKHNIPILTYEMLYSGNRELTEKNLDIIGLKRSIYNDADFNKALDFMDISNKYTEKQSKILNRNSL